METQRTIENSEIQKFKTGAEYLNFIKQENPDAAITVKPLEKETSVLNVKDPDSKFQSIVYPDGLVVETSKENPYAEEPDKKIYHVITYYQSGQIIEMKYDSAS